MNKTSQVPRGNTFKVQQPLGKTAPAFPKVAQTNPHGKILTDDHVFKATSFRQSDYHKILELQVTGGDIEFLNSGNDILNQLSKHLRKLDLSFNRISLIQNLQMLKQLVELNLSYNPIGELKELNLPQLQVLRLDGCQIGRIDNQFRVCKKLEILSLNQNRIREPSIQGGAQQLLELKELHLNGNRIQLIKSIYGYPALEELYLNNNPIEHVHEGAMREVKNLKTLEVCDAKFQNQDGDMKFICRLQNLTDLKLSRSFVDRDFQDLYALPDLWDLERLELQGVGLIWISGIGRKYPNLVGLDLKGNKIYAMEAINVLFELKSLAEINFSKNPICIHKDLREMISNAAPHIEIINKHAVKDAGHVYKAQVEELKDQLESITTQVIDAEEGIILEPPLKGQTVANFLSQLATDMEQDDRELPTIDSTLNKAVANKQKQMSIHEQRLKEAEKNFGKKLKKLTQDKKPDDGSDSDEYTADVKVFSLNIKKDFMDNRSKFREVMDKVRTREYDTFRKLDMCKDTGNRDAYNRMEEEKKLLRERFLKLGDDRVLINNLFAQKDDDLQSSEDDGDNQDEDFYKNEEDILAAQAARDSISGRIPGATPGQPTKLGGSASRGEQKTLPRTQSIDARKKQGLASIGEDPFEQGGIDQLPDRTGSSYSQRDVRVRNNSQSNFARRQQQRVTLMSKNKPHNLSSQNEQIKRMLGILPPEAKELPKRNTNRAAPNSSSLMNSSSKKSFGGSSFQTSNLSRTPAPSLGGGPVKATSRSVKGDDSDWEVEPLDMMTERYELQNVLEDYKNKKRKQQEAHKHNFLHRWLDNADRTIKEKEQPQAYALPKLTNLRKREDPLAGQSKIASAPEAPKKVATRVSPPKTKSILKTPKANLTESSVGTESGFQKARITVPSAQLSEESKAESTNPPQSDLSKPPVFTDLPASANLNLMAFEQQLMEAKRQEEGKVDIKPRYKVPMPSQSVASGKPPKQ